MSESTIIPEREDSVVAAELLELAAELGHDARVVKITHDPALVFLVPNDVAEAYAARVADRAETASPKRRRRAASDKDSEKDKEGTGGE